jgi:hypothetical protein
LCKVHQILVGFQWNLNLPTDFPIILKYRIWKKLTLILLTWRIWWVPNNARRWQMGFNSAFKGLILWELSCFVRTDRRTDRQNLLIE